jgi:hypothetical protein
MVLSVTCIVSLGTGVAAILWSLVVFIPKCDPYGVNAFSCKNRPLLGASLALGGLVVAALSLRMLSGRSRKE